MNKQYRMSGFTIVETMIVMAVTGIMFISVVLLINGKQQRAQFQFAVKDVQTQIRQIMTETTAGYNQLGNNTCSSFGGKPKLATGTTDTLGTNASCVFLGKTIIFSQDKESFLVAPVIGLRQPITTDFQGVFAADLNSSKPILSTDTIASQMMLQFGLSPVAMYVGDDLAQKVGSVSFVLTPGVKDISPGNQGTTSQNLNIVAVTNGSSLANSIDAERSAVETAMQNGTVSSRDYINSTDDKVKVSICFNSGTTNQSLLLTIGNGGNGIGLGSKIYGVQNCGAA
ncbi:type II secretion system protein [Candidatus Saccharibacteria bacterium]|nr:type II secretion system protein [Candidatus Saccharibacteria bacterium]HPG37412.1 type II secretion system protein [Candidatus Saccharibacteria bacterium]